MLNTYLTQLQNLLNQTNPSQPLWQQATLIGYINEARTWVASKSQCVRYLPAISSSLTTITISNAGSGYGAAPTVTISAPDQVPGTTATAVATISGGAVASLSITNAGVGYFSPNPPTVTIAASGSGTTATATCALGFINQTAANQEVYPFSAVSLGSGNGIAEILAVRSVSFIWGNFRYSSLRTSFSKYQATIRNYANTYTFVPSVVAQFGQGVNGSLYEYPVPNSAYQQEWDCICLPQPLNTDADIEAIPVPWQNCVKYYAAFLALEGLGRYKDAEEMLKRFKEFMLEARAQSQVGAVSNFYGRFP